MSTFNSADKQQLAAVLRCRGADMQPLVKLFEATFEATQKTLITAADVAVIHRLQGKAIVLRDFLELVKSADAILERST